MLRLALKSVRHNPKRLILTAIAVALGVSLVSATYTFTNAFSSGFNTMFKDIWGSVDVVVEPGSDVEYDPYAKEGLVTVADIDAIRGVDGVAAAEPSLSYETGQLLNQAGDAPLKQGPPTILRMWTGNDRIDNATVIEGRAPAADGEVVMDIDTFDQLGIAIGDKASIATDTGIADVTVVGTMRFGQHNSTQTAAFLAANEATVRSIGGLVNYYGASVVLSDGANAKSVVNDLNSVLPDNLRALTSEDKVKEQSEAFGDAMTLVNVFATVFGLVALFVGGYIIVNTFRIIITQRTREIGLLRAIGTTGTQVRGMILLEATTVGLLASAFGVGIGYLLALAGAALTEMSSGDILGTVTLPLSAVVWGLSLGVAITVASAFVPALHASAISPMEALRESATAGKKPLKARNLVGGALTLWGIGATWIGLAVDVSKPYIWVAVGAVLIVLGVTQLAAQVLVPVAFGLRGLLTKLWGVNGTLAANNIRREPRRSANTAAALMIGVMLLALVATFTASIKDTFTSQLGGVKAELLAQAQMSPIPQGAVDVIAGTPDVVDVSRYALDSASVDGTEYSLGTVDAVRWDALSELNIDTDASELGNGVFISPTMVKAGYEVGDVLTVVGSESTLDLTVTGLYLNDGDNDLLVNWETGAKLVGDPTIGMLMIDVADDADVNATQDAIKANLEDTFPLVDPQGPGDLQAFFDQVLTLVLAVITALLGAALVVAILGVANTLLLSVTERTREIGLLRAVGVRRGAVWGMVTLESVVMALFGTILGIVLGVGLGAAVVDALASFGLQRPVVPWLWIGIYTVMSLLAGVIAAVWPAWRASRLNILEAIAADG